MGYLFLREYSPEDEEVGAVPPLRERRLRRVVQGMITVSFWSMPMRFVPFFARMPTTLNETLLRRTWAPTALSPSSKSSSTTVCPRTQTVAAALTSRSVKHAPSEISQFCTTR